MHAKIGKTFLGHIYLLQSVLNHNSHYILIADKYTNLFSQFNYLKS